MIRKLPLFSLLFVIFFGIIAPMRPVQAACSVGLQIPNGSGSQITSCPTGKVSCFGNGINLTAQCCDSTAECPTGTLPSGTSQTAQICDFAGNKINDCRRCMGKGTATWTALGCISTDPAQFVGEVLRLGIGIGGGIAFLLILFGGFQILTSAGNPEQLNGGKELVSSAITGLLLIIFSMFLLRIIGYNIFGIPGFG